VEEPSVTNALEVLEAQALKLSAADRSRLLERLLDSLDVDPDVEATWDAVADAREAALEAAQVMAVPLDDAIARLEKRFPG
jgi:putative addiction module component (TIGR02574 family)